MRIKGIITAMVTPQNVNGIDEIATRKMVNNLIEKGVHGLFILGTNGEFFSISKNDKLKFVKIVVDEAKGRVPVFAGAGAISTTESIELINEFESIGVDAVSIITPYLIKLSQEELYYHYQSIIENTNVPIILYNIPQNTGINIEVGTLERLAESPKVIGIKDSSGNLDNLSNYINSINRRDFSVLVGSDSKILAALKLGASGAVSGTSNVLTKTNIAIYNSFEKNNIENAQHYQESLEDFRRILKLQTVPSVLKKCLQMIDLEVGKPYLPVLPVKDDANIQEIFETLDQYKKIEGWSEINAKA
ncbi:4-hydroxy-tetrahydrodipicolinate synthase [Macrococcus sp. EM39E]|uniref:4-hydroxy-tetrahydrodipicolinate synthase n=1 Tax=Macrococcus animalis TaxID=3395467 RepID=UPI0039BEB1A8